MPWIIVFCLVILCFCLVYYIHTLTTNNLKIVNILEDIQSGNINRRFNTTSSIKSLRQMMDRLNSFADHTEKILIAKQNLEIAQKQMISDISHDIWTPLTSLIGYIEALRNDRSLNEEEKRNFMKIIEAKSRSIYALVQEFFELSKLESDDTLVTLEKINLSEKVKEILVSFFYEFVRQNISPEIYIPEQPLYVWGNGTCIERVLNNLITNALRYGKDGGIVGISVRDDGNRAWVDIWDRGIGIPEQDLPYIFNRMYTCEKSRNEKFRGSGLGLSIALKLAERLKGEIVVSSIPGEKTTFSLGITKCDY